jgi:hypothetical protein
LATNEQLFVDPDVAAAELFQAQADAARQRMTQQVQAMTSTLAALTQMQQMAAEAVQEWSQRPQPLIDAVQPVMPALIGPAVSRQQAKAYASKLGVSERTVWRRLEKGEVTAADIIATDTIEEG